MFIVRDARPLSPFGGAEWILTYQLNLNSAPPNGAGDFCVRSL